MPKLCDKCHSKPAVVHIRAMTPEGTRETSSYCLDCAMELFGHGDIPADFREMLEELLQLEKNLKKRSQSAAFLGEQEEKEEQKLTCPHCGCVAGESYEKCGYCFASLRSALPQNPYSLPPSYLILGGPRLAVNAVQERAKRIPELLQLRENAFLKGRIDGVESVQDELSALRQTLMEEALGKPSPPFKETNSLASDILSKLPIPLHGGTIFPFPYPFLSPYAEELPLPTPLVRLSLSYFFYRTLVDPPGGFPSDPEQCRRKMEDLFSLSPFFRGGFRREGEPAIFSCNGRLRAVFGRTEEGMVPPVADGRVILSYTHIPIDGVEISDYKIPLVQAWERDYHFFQDPELGFFHPLGGLCQSASHLVYTLHLPALMALMGLERLRNVLHFLEGVLPDEDHSYDLFLDPPSFLPEDPQAPQEAFPCGLLVLKDGNQEWDKERKQEKRILRIAQTLEKRERQARKWFLHHSDARENLLDAISHSRALLRSARTLTLPEMATALSRLWLGQELGCFPSLPRPRILKAMAYLLDRIVQGPVPTPPERRGAEPQTLPLTPCPKSKATWEPSLLSWEEQIAPAPPPPTKADLQNHEKLLRQINQEITERVREILETPEASA